MSETLKNKIVTTRKDHTCFACSRPFPKGSRMRIQTTVWDGDIFTVRNCMACDEIMRDHPEGVMDDWENVFHEDCVMEMIRSSCDKPFPTPEEWLQTQTMEATHE